jgi:glutathione S-transferase
MKLYFSPGACSLSPHIALREAGLAFDLEKVNLGTKQTATGADYRTINPKGYVPALRLDDGTVLTEGPAIVQYIGDRKPETKLVPANGTLERYQLQAWLNFIATEMHKTFSPLFHAKTPEEVRQSNRDLLGKRLTFVSQSLEGQPFLMGDTFTVADGYLATVLAWTKPLKIDLGQWPTVKAHFDRVVARPAVQAAMKAEGLLK